MRFPRSSMLLIATYHVLTCALIAFAETITAGQSPSSAGRIPELDEVVAKYAAEIATGHGAHKLVEALEKVSKTVTPQKEQEETLDYYVHVAELLERQGTEALSYEEERIQQVMQSAQSSTDKSLEKVTKERRVLDAYYGAAADYFSKQFLEQGFDGIPNFNIRDGNAGAFKAGDGGSHHQQRKVKVVTDHEEM